MKILGLIPARGGSKGVPKKNIRLVNNSKPLLHYAIAAGQQSKLLDFLVVDTDNDEVEAVAALMGVNILKRPSALAQDDSSVVDVALRVIHHLENDNIVFDIIVLLQPTSPIRTGKNIDEAVDLLIKNPNSDAVISVVALDDVHPARMYNIDEEKLVPLHPELEAKRRQDLSPLYYRNGCIYVIRVDTLLKEKTFMPQNKLAYIMPSNWLANIDNERDFIVTEALVSAWENGII
jgi:CMP-N-acetylneuraminic acid synthetase